MPEIIDCDQNTEEWFLARMGIPTASSFSAVMAKGDGKTRTAYMHKLAGEIISGEPMEGYSNAAMERGHELEPDARQQYEFICDNEVHQVGFMRNSFAGCSPDGLIGNNGMLEIKSKCPHTMIPVILRDDPPPEYKAQLQGQLWVSEREWVDFVAYCPRFPLVVRRVYRDSSFIAEISEEVIRFSDELSKLVLKILAIKWEAG